MAFVALLTVCAVQAADEVHMTDNKLQRGTVTKDAVEGVTLTPEGSGGGSMTIPAEKVENVVFEVQNADFQSALISMNSGDYATAAATFQALSADESQMKVFREVAKPYLAYLVGECFYRAGKHQDAVTAFERFMKEHKSSRYVPMAVGNMVDSAIQAKKLDAVPDLLQKLKDMGGENKARALLLGAELDLQQSNVPGAEAKYNEAATSSTKKATQAIARLGLAKIAIAKKENDKARRMAEQALSGSSTPSVCATAYLIVGDVLVAEAETAKADASKDKLLDAALAYLRIPILYANDKNTEPEALYKAGNCFVQLSKHPGRAADRERARTLLNMIVQRYKNTRWNVLATEVLKKMG